MLDRRGPLAAQRRTSGVSAALQLHPTVTAAGDGVSHPARSYGASWRRAALDDDQQSHRCQEIAARSPTIRKSAAPPRTNAYRLHRKRATMSMPWLLVSATAVGQERPRWRSGRQRSDCATEQRARRDRSACSAHPASVRQQPPCRSRTGAGVDHADHIAAGLERHQPPPWSRASCWFVAAAALSLLLPLPTGCRRVTPHDESGCVVAHEAFPPARQS